MKVLPDEKPVERQGIIIAIAVIFIITHSLGPQLPITQNNKTSTQYVSKAGPQPAEEMAASWPSASGVTTPPPTPTP